MTASAAGEFSRKRINGQPVRRDHVALMPSELSDDALRAILASEPAQESYDNNKLLD